MARAAASTGAAKAQVRGIINRGRARMRNAWAALAVDPDLSPDPFGPLVRPDSSAPTTGDLSAFALPCDVGEFSGLARSYSVSIARA